MERQTLEYEFVGKNNNDGDGWYEEQLLTDEETYKRLGAETIQAIRKDIFRIINNKIEIYGGITIENEDTIALADEVIYKNKITGATLSFTYTTVHEVIKSEIPLIYTVRGFEFPDGDKQRRYNPTPDIIPESLKGFYPPIYLNTKTEKEIYELLNPNPIIVKFRPDL